jgi:hypothetical protein
MNTYTMNIARNGRHVCRVILPGSTTGETLPVAREVRARFPASEGFDVTLTVTRTVGQDVPIEA